MYLINHIYLFDFLVFIFCMQFMFMLNHSMLLVLSGKFYSTLGFAFDYSKDMPMSYYISLFTFLALLVSCFGGYFSYAVTPCGMFEFTLSYSMVAWLTTLFMMISVDKFSVIMSKEGDSYPKSLAMTAVELVSDFSRPLALTVRLTVNILVGHMMVEGVYSLAEFTSESSILLSLFAISMEFCVFFIQSYIFSRLIYLYMSE